jgi:hypothetical protein
VVLDKTGRVAASFEGVTPESRIARTLDSLQ